MIFKSCFGVALLSCSALSCAPTSEVMPQAKRGLLPGSSGVCAARCRSFFIALNPASLRSPQVENPFLDLAFQPPTVERFALRKSFKGHLNSVSAVAFHPRKVSTADTPYHWQTNATYSLV